MIDNETWKLVPPPESSNVVGSKWVLKIKRDTNGNINSNKAKLVVQGYSQKLRMGDISFFKLIQY